MKRKINTPMKSPVGSSECSCGGGSPCWNHPHELVKRKARAPGRRTTCKATRVAGNRAGSPGRERAAEGESLQSIHTLISNPRWPLTCTRTGRCQGEQQLQAEKNAGQRFSLLPTSGKSQRFESCQLTGAQGTPWMKVQRQHLRSKDNTLGIRMCHEAKGNTPTEHPNKV